MHFYISVEATFHKNALIKKFYFILLNRMFLVDIENNYLILGQFGYLLCISYTVFEIFDFNVSRVLPLTFEGHPRFKVFLLFESPYMTSYLTVIDTFALSRTVFEKLDFKVFGV